MSVEKVSEWNSYYDGSLEGLQEAVEEIRSAGAPGECEATVSGGGNRWTLRARFYYVEDDDGEDSEVPDPVEGVTV